MDNFLGVEANHHMAAVLETKGGAYQYVFCLNCGRTDHTMPAQARAGGVRVHMAWIHREAAGDTRTNLA